MKEREIRPKKIHQTIIKLSQRDTARYFLPRQKEFKTVGCPACGSKKKKLAFFKFKCAYQRCQNCFTIYLSPRPSEQLMSALYNKLESVKYWETDFYKKTVAVRRAKMFAPRAQKVVNAAKKFLSAKGGKTLIDVGCGYGVFLEEIKKLNYFQEIIGVEPAALLAAATAAKGFKVLEQWIDSKTVKKVPYRASVVTCFEVLEHVFDPREFLNTFSELVLPGGLLILSFPSGSGLDVQLLGENSKTIYPPHHINIMTTEGIRALARRTKNLQIIGLATPGELDVDIAFNALREGAVSTLGPFFDYIYARQDEDLWRDLQIFCRDHLLSSHLFVILRKKI